MLFGRWMRWFSALETHCKPSLIINGSVIIYSSYRVAYRSGVTLATSSLRKNVFAGRTPVIAGVSASFRTGFPHAMEQGAIVQTATALHISIGRASLLSSTGSVAVSEQMAGIRRLLMGWEDEKTETGLWFKRASEASSSTPDKHNLRGANEDHN